jgi:S-methylmethionine-dependent homocysteine/selenocysteine methylase
MTWRASAGWGRKIGYDRAELERINRQAIELLAELRRELETERTPIVISGCMGPRGDGYDVAEKMSAREAEDYHRPQIETFAETDADMVSAFTMNYVEEAIGLSRAGKAAGMPVVISFTVETDGRLPSGQALGDAITEVDAATEAAPAYYMINCVHPTHFADQLAADSPWVKRLMGLRANASAKSHEELDEAEELDSGDPVRLGDEYRRLRNRLPHIRVLGGCCGTDLRHVQEICKACLH